MTLDEPFDSEKHEMRLDISTHGDGECAACARSVARGQLIVFMRHTGGAFAWVLCLECARRRLEAFLPVWDERQKMVTSEA